MIRYPAIQFAVKRALGQPAPVGGADKPQRTGTKAAGSADRGWTADALTLRYAATKALGIEAVARYRDRPFETAFLQ
jgi:hypothetical protein